MNADLPSQKKLISISQAAELLGVSIDTVRRWDNSGVLHSERPDGKNRYFSLSELEEHKSGQPLSISEAAKELGISPTTLRRLEARGLLVPNRNSAGERVYNKEALDAFLRSDYFRRKNHDIDYFRRKNPIKEENTDFSQDEKNISKDSEIEVPAKNDKNGNRNDSNTNLSPFPPAESSQKPFSNPIKSSYRIPEILASIVIFLLLTAIGTTNITLTKIKSTQSTNTPAVLSETTEQKPGEASGTGDVKESEATPAAEPTAEPIPEPTIGPVTPESVQSLIEGDSGSNPDEATEEAKEKEESGGSPDLDDFKIILGIKTGDANFVDITEKPSTESGIISKAQNGDTFEMISSKANWYEIKFNNNSAGFISKEFAEIKEIN